MQLIVFSGLPCTGKTSLAEAVGRELGCPVFVKDWFEATLKRCGLGQHSPQAGLLGYAGYELLTMLARRQLHLGQSAILDSVVGLERTRQEWRSLAASYRAGWRVIECVYSDEALHQARLAARPTRIPFWPHLDWAAVVRVKASYEPWTEDHLVLDAANPLAENIETALAYIRTPSQD